MYVLDLCVSQKTAEPGETGVVYVTASSFALLHRQILPQLPLQFHCACVDFVSTLLSYYQCQQFSNMSDEKKKGVPAGSRIRDTGMGGLYVTATLLALLRRLAIFDQKH